MEQKEKLFNYLDLPTSELLEQFGKGSHIPGSGSAAALSSLIGIELLRTVTKLTQTKKSYKEVHSQMEFIQKKLENDYKPLLIDIFYKDSEEFGKVSNLRMARDKESDPKKKEKLGRQAIAQLKLATEIPIELCQINFKLLEFAISIFDNGYRATRGDAGVAISNFLSAISGTLFVVLLNIRVSKKSKWSEEKRIQAEELTLKYIKVQKEAFSKVVTLYSEGLSEDQIPINFDS